MEAVTSQGLLEDALEQVASAADERALDEVRVRLLGKKGELTTRLKSVGKLPPEQRREAGQSINRAKQALEKAISERASELARQRLDQTLAAESVDVTLPGRKNLVGGIHPVSRAIDRKSTRLNSSHVA